VKKRDFLSLYDFTTKELSEILDLATNIKKRPNAYKGALAGKTIALIFEKPSLRTKATFEVGIMQMGGNVIYFSPNEFQLGRREAVSDVAKNLERWVDGVVCRTFGHNIIETLARNCSKPVINALTDLSHPCQGLADYFTIREHKHKLKGLKLAYVGDGNNVCHSLIYGAAKFGIEINIATPRGYEPKVEVLKNAYADAVANGVNIELTDDPIAAVNNVDVVYTDVWTSMGQEAETAKRRQIFAPYQVNSRLMAFAKKDAVFMHCLPAHRGEEVTDEVIDSEQSIVFDQAENRLHVQKAIMLFMFGLKKK